MNQNEADWQFSGVGETVKHKDRGEDETKGRERDKA